MKNEILASIFSVIATGATLASEPCVDVEVRLKHQDLEANMGSITFWKWTQKQAQKKYSKSLSQAWKSFNNNLETLVGYADDASKMDDVKEALDSLSRMKATFDFQEAEAEEAQKELDKAVFCIKTERLAFKLTIKSKRVVPRILKKQASKHVEW